MRGKLTDAIKNKGTELLGVVITQEELRLMPYLQYLVMNDQNLDPNRINQLEREVLSQWRTRGWITGGASDLSITKEFWDALNELMWLGYVAYEEEPLPT